MAFLPFVASAASYSCTQNAGTVEALICKLMDLANNVLIPALIIIGVIWFIWGIIKFITANDEESKKKARETMISGIIGLVVIFSFWGFIRLIQGTLGTGGVNTLPPPTL